MISALLLFGNHIPRAPHWGNAFNMLRRVQQCKNITFHFYLSPCTYTDIFTPPPPQKKKTSGHFSILRGGINVKYRPPVNKQRILAILLSFNQCCGSRIQSVTLWIRTRISHTDPEPHSEKKKTFDWLTKIHRFNLEFSSHDTILVYRS